ncbi:MAG: hypothetical protein U0Y82_07690 [Thermoleophilia bacterium]
MSVHEQLFVTDAGVLGTREAFGEGLGLNVAQDLVRRREGTVAHMVRVEEVVSRDGFVCELRTNAGRFEVRVVCEQCDIAFVTSHGTSDWRASVPVLDSGEGDWEFAMPVIEQAAHAARTAGLYFEAGAVTQVQLGGAVEA